MPCEKEENFLDQLQKLSEDIELCGINQKKLLKLIDNKIKTDKQGYFRIFINMVLHKRVFIDKVKKLPTIEKITPQIWDVVITIYKGILDQCKLVIETDRIKNEIKEIIRNLQKETHTAQYVKKFKELLTSKPLSSRSISEMSIRSPVVTILKTPSKSAATPRKKFFSPTTPSKQRSESVPVVSTRNRLNSLDNVKAIANLKQSSIEAKIAAAVDRKSKILKMASKNSLAERLKRQEAATNKRKKEEEIIQLRQKSNSLKRNDLMANPQKIKESRVENSRSARYNNKTSLSVRSPLLHAFQRVLSDDKDKKLLQEAGKVFQLAKNNWNSLFIQYKQNSSNQKLLQEAGKAFQLAKNNWDSLSVKYKKV